MKVGLLRISAAVLLGLTPAAFGGAAIEADLLASYAASYASSVGGEDNAQVIIANTVAGSNAIQDQGGTGARMRIAGFYQSANDVTGQTTTGGIVNWLAGNDSHLADVVAQGAALGADLVVYICNNSDASSIAGVSQQPGYYSALNPGAVWSAVFAHETGGHSYGRSHSDGILNPKTIMLHNYCGGGAAPPYFYTNPNLWFNGVQLLGDGVNNCSMGGLINGGDNSSCGAQAVADRRDRVVTAPNLTNVVLHWMFTNAPGSAPAGTTNYDLISGAPAIVRGAGAIYTGTSLRIPGGTTGNVAMNVMSAYIDLPNGIISSPTNITIEIWAAPRSAPNWARLCDFGRCAEAGDGLGAAGEYTGASTDPAPGATTAYDDLTLSAAIGTDLTQQRFEARLAGYATTVNAGLATVAGVQHHYAITFTDGAGAAGAAGGRWQWFRDGDAVTFLDVTNHLSSIHDVNNWLGRSLWSGDSNANNDYAEVRISNVALSRNQILASFLLGPNYLPGASVALGGSDAAGASSFNAAGQWSNGSAPSAATNYETYDFRLRTPATSGSYGFAGNSLRLSGGELGFAGTGASTITINNLILNGAEVRNRATSTLTLAGNVTVTSNGATFNSAGGENTIAANVSGAGNLNLYGYYWMTLSGANSGFTGKTILGNGQYGTVRVDSESRLGANPATFTADQLTLNRGVLVSTATFAISNANRGIYIGPSGATFNTVGGSTLTLATPMSSPNYGSSIQAGTLTKTGAGTLVLNNPVGGFNGAVFVDTASTSANDGVLRVVNGAALVGARSPIYIRNSGNGTSTLQLDGTSGAVSLSQSVSLNGRNSSTPAIENIAGTNTLAGGIGVYGSGNFPVQVDAGVLNMGGAITSSDGGAETITFQGAGTANLNGTVANGGGTMSLNKTGSGTLNLAAGSTYSGGTTVSQGTLALAASSAPVLHLTFDNAAGSGNGGIITNVGTGGGAMNGRIVSTGGASIVSGGRYGNALSLNGTGGNASNNIVIITNKVLATDASGSWTLGYWVKTSTAGAVILYQGDGTWSSSGQTTFYLNSSNTAAGTRAGCVRWAGGWLTGTTALNNNVWHFIALVDNAGTQTIYVDGSLDTAVSTMTLPLASGANQIWIGGSPDSGDGATKMSGLIDEVYLFNRALSLAEIQSLKNNNAITNAPANSLPVNSPLTVAAGGVLDLAGVSQTVAALSGNGLVTNSGAPATLTVSNNTGMSLFGGVLADTAPAGAVSLVVSGAGTTVLAGANAYHGPTTVSRGTLKLSPVADDAVLHLAFDNAAGGGDGSVITNTGTGGAAMNGKIVSTGGATIAAGGRFGNALSLNGTGGNASNNIVVIPNKVLSTDAGSSWSVGYWIKTATAGAVILYQGDGTWSSSGQTMFYLNNDGTTSGTHAGAVRWGGAWLTGTAALNNNTWHFITLVDSAGIESIYVDGNVDTVTSTMANPLASGANQIWIGGSPDPGDGAAKMSGLIDEVYMFNRALSRTEVQSLYNNNSLSTNGGNVLPATTPVSVAAGATLDMGGVSQTIASLTGGGMVTNTAGPATLIVSNSAGTTTFSGSIGDASPASALSFVQSGGATTIMSGASTYRGSSAVNGGTLLINGSLGSGGVAVNGGTLGGNGVIGGALTVQSGGTLAPGAGVGVLAVSGNVTLQPGSTTLMEIGASPPTNDQLLVAGTLSYGGTLVVTNLSGTLAANDSFQLFGAGSVSGGFASNSLPLLAPGLGWNFNPVNGRLSVVQTVATNPTNISYVVNGASLTLSWPADHLGWRLQAQTNPPSLGLGTNWVDLPDSTNATQMALPLNNADGSIFFRLVFP